MKHSSASVKDQVSSSAHQEVQQRQRRVDQLQEAKRRHWNVADDQVELPRKRHSAWMQGRKVSSVTTEAHAPSMPSQRRALDSKCTVSRLQRRTNPPLKVIWPFEGEAETWPGKEMQYNGDRIKSTAQDKSVRGGLVKYG